MSQVFKRSAATALVAMVQKLSLHEEVDDASFDALMAELCADPKERSALLLALKQANDPDLRLILTDRLRAKATAQMATADSIGGRDTATGPWAQGFTGTLVVLAVGSMITGTLSFALGVPSLLIGAAMLGLVSFARLRASDRRTEAKRKADAANDLIKSIGEIRADPADSPKTPRK